jgi:hypothetical protein
MKRRNLSGRSDDFVTNNRNFQATCLETSLCSNGINEAKPRVRSFVSPCGQSGIRTGLLLSTSIYSLNYHSNSIFRFLQLLSTP